MILTILDDFNSFANGLTGIIRYIGDGIQSFFSFIIKLPSLTINLISCIPQPFSAVIGSFIGLIITIILIKVVRLFI